MKQVVMMNKKEHKAEKMMSKLCSEPSIHFKKGNDKLSFAESFATFGNPSLCHYYIILSIIIFGVVFLNPFSDLQALQITVNRVAGGVTR